jgi:hypothetical protein
MGLFDKVFSSKSTSKTTRDPWAPAVDSAKGLLGEGKAIYDKFSDLSPEEQAQMEARIGVLKTRQGDPFTGQARGAASGMLNGSTPDLENNYGVAAARVGYDMGTANPAKARAGQGELDPSSAYKKLLSGQVDNPQLQGMADAATRSGQRAYADMIADADESLSTSVLPSIRSGAVSSGGYGGSRQGIAEGLAMGKRNTAAERGARDLGIAANDATATLFGNAYESAQNRMAGAASELDARAQQAKQFDAKNAFDARTTNANLDQQAQQFNANNTLARNAQTMAKTHSDADLKGKAMDLFTGANSSEDDDFGQMMSVLGMPRSIKQGMFNDYSDMVQGVAGLGGTSNTTQRSRKSFYQMMLDNAAQAAKASAGG